MVLSAARRLTAQVFHFTVAWEIHSEACIQDCVPLCTMKALVELLLLFYPK